MTLNKKEGSAATVVLARRQVVIDAGVSVSASAACGSLLVLSRFIAHFARVEITRRSAGRLSLC